jgi:hypothetical protein
LPSDPWLDVVPPPSPRAAAVVSFPGHVIVAADVDRRWTESWLADGDLSGPLKPVFLGALEERLRLVVNNTDVVLMAPAADGEPPIDLTPVPLDSVALTLAPLASAPLASDSGADHPRVVRARRCRTDVCAWTVDGGIVVLGRGLGGRWEVAIDVTEPARNAGLGRALAAAVRHLVPDQGRRCGRRSHRATRRAYGRSSPPVTNRSGPRRSSCH